MSREIFQDIVPPEKRSIKKIPVPERTGRANTSRTQSKKEFDIIEEVPHAVGDYSPRISKKKPIFIVFVLLALLLVVVGGYVFFSKTHNATITLSVKSQILALQSQTFSATTSSALAIQYQTITTTKDGKLAVSAVGDEYIQTKASGIIRIFNTNSANAQKLIANTRFENDKGLVYRITKAVTVPGKIKDTPGSIDVTVVADKYGPDYNIPLSDFTIPGFKGDPKYTTIFARSVSTISGGFSGMRKKIDKSQAIIARQKINSELEADLIKRTTQNIPDSFVMIPGSYVIRFTQLPDEQIGDVVYVSQRATINAFIFKRTSLAQAFANQFGDSYKVFNDFIDTKSLVFKAGVASTTDFWLSKPIIFTVTGTTTMSVSIDTNKMKEDLLGKQKSEFNAIIGNYPGVLRGELKLDPFWLNTIPKNIENIKIISNVTTTSI
jgi:hypothetical protein